jgi:hypothetical protein
MVRKFKNGTSYTHALTGIDVHDFDLFYDIFTSNAFYRDSGHGILYKIKNNLTTQDFIGFLNKEGDVSSMVEQTLTKDGLFMEVIGDEPDLGVRITTQVFGNKRRRLVASQASFVLYVKEMGDTLVVIEGRNLSEGEDPTIENKDLDLNITVFK